MEDIDTLTENDHEHVTKCGPFNKLDEDSERIKQPKGLKIELKPHQAASVYAMRQIEQKGSIVIENPDITSDFYQIVSTVSMKEFSKSVFKISTDFAILGDKVGAGKSYTMLSLILSQKVPETHDNILIGNNHYSIRMESSQSHEKVNLIIVPHTLLDQWDGFLKKTKLKYKRFSTEKDFDSLKQEKEHGTDFYNEKGEKTLTKKTKIKIPKEKKVNHVLAKYNVFLLNVNKYNDFNVIFNHRKWARIIIDEADTIKLPRTFIPKANFTWLMTATYNSIADKTTATYIGSLVGKDKALLQYFVVKNNDTFVESSFTLPVPYVYMVRTKLNIILQRFHDLIPDNVMELINAGNMQEAMDKLDCKVDTQENIISILTDKIKKNLHNLKNDLAHHKNRIADDEEAHKLTTDRLKKAIRECKEKLFDITDRIESIKSECCFICAEEFNGPVMMNCCKNIFCLACLLSSIKKNNSCPMCRSHIKSKNDYTLISNESNKKKKKKTDKVVRLCDMEKKDALNELLKQIKEDDSKARVLIFSSHSHTFEKITECFKNNDMTYAELKGSETAIKTIKTQYSEGEINILLLNSEKLGSGSNLQMSDYLILFNRLPTDTEKQVIGRAQRYGRKNPLRIIYLINEMENDNIPYDDIFELESKDDIFMLTNPPIREEPEKPTVEKPNKKSSGSKKMKK